MAGIVTAVMVAAVGALAVAWAAALMCERGMHPLRKLRDALRRPALERALLAAVAVGFIHHGATKGTNGVNQLPPAPFKIEVTAVSALGNRSRPLVGRMDAEKKES